MRFFPVLFLLVSGCVHHLYVNKYTGADGKEYFELVCDRKAGATKCVKYAQNQCDNEASVMILTASQDLALPGVTVERIVPDPSLKPGQTRMTSTCKESALAAQDLPN